MSDFVKETAERIDGMLATAERNGWNAAINAARQILPVEYSQRIRPLYKFTEEERASLSSQDRGEK